MKWMVWILIMNCSSLYSLCQDAKSMMLEDSLIGWVKIYNYKGVKEGKTTGGRMYTSAQLSICDSFANWMQASYIPKGGQGDIKKFSIGRGSSSEPYQAGLPNRYGATAYTWSVKLVDGKIQTIPETQFWWTITANGVPLMPEWVIPDLSDSSKQFFLLPSFSVEEAVSKKQYYKDQDIAENENIKPFIYKWIYRSTGGGTENIILAKNNKSPFRIITKGEFLEAWVQTASSVHAKMLQKINYDYSGDKIPLDIATKNENKLHQDCLVFLSKLKDQYKDRLAEPAEINTLQHDRRDIAKGRDLFEKKGNGDSYPVYRIQEGMVELSKKNTPQWILINWNWNKSDAKEYHMHNSIIDNFNFSYVYNFFFNPEKVKGVVYTPLKSPNYKEKSVIVKRSEEALSAEKNKDIYFFNDFSANGVGQAPLDWYHAQSLNGEKATVIELETVAGKWLQIKGNKIIPKTLTPPFPENFALSFDVAVPEKFPWGGRSLQIILSENDQGTVEKSTLVLNIRPGYNGRPGEVYLETKLPTGYYQSNKTYSLPGFSNNKKINKVKLSLKKSGEQIQLYVESTLAIDIKKGIPEHLLFRNLSFSHLRSDSEMEKYFLSSIKVIKE